MSTGLTYVTLYDVDPADPQGTSTSFVFASYSEAYEYGRWYTQLYGAVNNAVRLAIWTSGPNDNGVWYYNTSTNIATFAIVD